VTHFLPNDLESVRACRRQRANLKCVDTTRGPIYYDERGRGQAVVLIHGSVSDLRIWQPIVPALARHYRVIAYSRRHHWPNPPPFDEYSFVNDVNDLNEMMGALRLSAAHLVAHSAGALVAVEFARRYTEKTMSLALFDPNGPGILSASEEAIVASERGEWLGPVRTALAAGDDKAALQYLLKPFVESSKLPKWFGLMADDNLAALKRQFAGKSEPPSVTCDELSRYPGSVLVLQGERSPRSFQMVNQAFRRCARNAQLETVNDCGHLFQVDAPEEALKRIMRFIKTKQDENLPAGR
jgi:non-heme chloroperoxidase